MRIYRYKRRTLEEIEVVGEYHGQPARVTRDLAWREVVVGIDGAGHVFRCDDFEEFPSEVDGLDWGVFADTLRVPLWLVHVMYERTEKPLTRKTMTVKAASAIEPGQMVCGVDHQDDGSTLTSATVWMQFDGKAWTVVDEEVERTEKPAVELKGYGAGEQPSVEVAPGTCDACGCDLRTKDSISITRKGVEAHRHCMACAHGGDDMDSPGFVVGEKASRLDDVPSYSPRAMVFCENDEDGGW